MEFQTHHVVNPRLDGIGPVSEPKCKPKVDIGCLYRAAIAMGLEPVAKMNPEPAFFVYDRENVNSLRYEEFIFWRRDRRILARKRFRKFLWVFGSISILTILNFVDFT